jgi:prepilin-type processing-associated H-X9-DG protein
LSIQLLRDPRANGSNPSDVPHGYRYDLLINGTVVVHDTDHHYGETIQLQSADASQQQSATTSAGSQGGGGTQVTNTAAITYTYVPCDYGLSRGYYTGTLSRDAPFVDSKLFMVVDYPKPLIDYTSTEDDFDMFFIDTDADPGAKDWLTSISPHYCGGDTNWKTYQSLRHFNRANMLYCDGHIESLSKQDLTSSGNGIDPQKDPRWQFGRIAPTGQ